MFEVFIVFIVKLYFIKNNFLIHLCIFYLGEGTKQGGGIRIISTYGKSTTYLYTYQPVFERRKLIDNIYINIYIQMHIM